MMTTTRIRVLEPGNTNGNVVRRRADTWVRRNNQETTKSMSNVGDEAYRTSTVTIRVDVRTTRTDTSHLHAGTTTTTLAEVRMTAIGAGGTTTAIDRLEIATDRTTMVAWAQMVGWEVHSTSMIRQ